MKPIRAAASMLVASIVSAALLGACDRTTPPAPPMEAKTTAPAARPEVFARFEQRSGVIRVRLATELAPRTCMSFINLAERGYFNGRAWDEFSTVVRQAGETYSMYTLPHEFTPKLLFDRPGLLCVSNTTNDANARAKPTRIFITVKAQDRWNLVYAPFGQVVEGLEVAQSLTAGEAIDRIAIEGDTAALRARHARELAEWNRAIDKAASQPAR
jgi:peptidyl-prolyl cis-trans isomerase B (cyclophilin B)